MGDIVNEEIWKNITITGYEQYYKISTHGNIKSLHTNKLLKQSNRGTYLGVQLSARGTSRTESIHRLVALSFIENPDNLPIVNHKDGDKLNNKLSNLEWVSNKENVKHARDTKLHISKTYRVSQYKDDELVKTYNSITDAKRETGISDSKICCVCKGKRKSAGGFVWKYADFEYKEDEKPDGRELKDFPKYIILPDGQVFSKSSKKYLSTRINSGYKYVTLYNGKKKKDCSIHSLVALAYLENLHNFPMVNHKNHDRLDNRVDNLEWTSYSDNMKKKAQNRRENNDNKELASPV